MKHILYILFFLGSGATAKAANADTVRYSGSGACWSIVHRFGAGEQLSFLAQRYRVPAGMLERAYPGLTELAGNGEVIEIPIGAYNRIVDMPWSLDTARPLYYKVQLGEKLSDISRCARMDKNELMLINGLSGEPAAGKYLCVGWVRYNRRLVASSPLPNNGNTIPPPVARSPSPTPVPRPAPTFRQPKPQDSIVVNFSGREHDDTLVATPPPVQTMGDIWNQQTNNGESFSTEKGSVAFYQLNSKAPGAAAYAFHNSAPRGGIIRVRNLNNGKSIYVKVLGPIPNTKQYSGAILGLTMTAKRALGVKEDRAFCELAFAGY